MASLGLAVTQQLQRGSPCPGGIFPTAAGWVTPHLTIHMCVCLCTHPPCRVAPALGAAKGPPMSGPVGVGTQGRGACMHMDKPVCVHGGTWTCVWEQCNHTTAAAVAGGDMHARSCACACSATAHALLAAHAAPSQPQGCLHTRGHAVHVDGPSPICVYTGETEAENFVGRYPAP